MRLIILAAGQGKRLRPLTDHRPKCMIEVDGKPLLGWQLEVARRTGIEEIIVVGGYRSDLIEMSGIRLVRNTRFRSTNMVVSLYCAEDYFGDAFIVSYGDIIYSADVMRTLLADNSPIGLVVDLDWEPYWRRRFDDPLEDAESLQLGANGRITSIGQPVSSTESIEAQYIGLMKFQGAGIEALRSAYREALEADAHGLYPFDAPRPFSTLYMTDLLQGMVHRGDPVYAVPVRGEWVEIDRPHDLELAQDLISAGRLESRGVAER